MIDNDDEADILQTVKLGGPIVGAEVQLEGQWIVYFAPLVDTCFCENVTIKDLGTIEAILSVGEELSIEPFDVPETEHGFE